MNLPRSIKDRVPIVRLAAFVASLVVLTALSVFGQPGDTRGKNNPYSPSPTRTNKPEEPPIKPAAKANNDIVFVMQSAAVQETRPTVAQRTLKIAKSADLRSMPLTEIYKVGVGDVLFVNLKNSAQSAGYYTVGRDGTIDFPLAGEHVVVADQTVDSIEEIIASGITLYSDPQVEVKVREYASHAVTVSGLVERPGEKNLQREAMPLFVIRAEAIVDQKATRALITRAPLLKVETYDLRDSKTDDVLIYPGNAVEFAGDNGRLISQGSYFISGEIASPGQKELTQGLTLYQGVVAAGGAKGDPKKAVVRRKNEKGVFVISEHNLRSIRDGKAADPAITAGDIIELRN